MDYSTIKGRDEPETKVAPIITDGTHVRSLHWTGHYIADPTLAVARCEFLLFSFRLPIPLLSSPLRPFPLFCRSLLAKQYVDYLLTSSVTHSYSLDARPIRGDWIRTCMERKGTIA